MNILGDFVRRVAVIVLTAALVGFGVAAPAHADGKPRPGVSVTPDGPSSGQISGQQTQTQTSPGSSGSSGTSSGSSSGSGGSSSGVPGIPGLTNSANSCDPANYPGGYSDDFAVPSPCIQPTGGGRAPEEAPAPPVITTQMVTEAARVTAPTTPPHVEPGEWSFVNVPNNYWTDAPTVRTSVNILGQQIPLTWTPTGTTWSFGDGSTATGNGVEGADLGAAGAVEHAYDRQGSYDITTTTTYNLVFVLPGQGPQTIALTSPPSPPATLPVSEVQSLVDYVR